MVTSQVDLFGHVSGARMHFAILDAFLTPFQCTHLVHQEVVSCVAGKS